MQQKYDMKATDSYSDKVSNYIKEEYGEKVLAILLHPDIADTAIMTLIVHEQAGVPVQDSAVMIAEYLKTHQIENKKCN